MDGAIVTEPKYDDVRVHYTHEYFGTSAGSRLWMATIEGRLMTGILVFVA